MRKNLFILCLGILTVICGCASELKQLSKDNALVILEGKHFAVGYSTVTGTPGISYYNGVIARYNPDTNLGFIITNDGVNTSVAIIGDTLGTQTSNFEKSMKNQIEVMRDDFKPAKPIPMIGEVGR